MTPSRNDGDSPWKARGGISLRRNPGESRRRPRWLSVTRPLSLPIRILAATVWVISAAAIAPATAAAGVDPSAPARTATIEVRVKDPDGAPLSDLNVGLQALPDPTLAAGGRSDPWIWLYAYRLNARTDAQGKAFISNVRVGSYSVNVGLPGNSYFIPPGQNPLSPQPTLTIVMEGERSTVDLVLARGDRMSCQLEIPYGPVASGKVIFVETTTGSRAESILQSSGNTAYLERLLPPGRWEVTIDPPEGVLLQEFEMDRVPLPGSRATIDVIDGGRNVNLTWRYAASCRVTGALTWNLGDSQPGQVVAHLVRPGPWYDDAVRRGGSKFDSVRARSVRPGMYEVYLPNGSWRLQPEGDLLESSTPPFIDLDLSPGQEASADFDLKAKPEATEQSVLNVRVESPDGRPLEHALVAVWPLGAEKNGQEPLKRGETTGTYYPEAVILGLPKGSYLVAAGHEQYTEGRAEVREFQAATGQPSKVTVSLGRGAVVRALAKDEKGTPIENIVLKVSRLGDSPPSLVKDPDLAKRRKHRTAATDETGRLKIWGLDSGTYSIEPTFGKDRQRTHFLRIARGEKLLEGAVETALTENEETDVDLRLVPAASLTARLACSDAGPLPRKASIRLLSPSPDDETVADPAEKPSQGPDARSGARASKSADHGKEKDVLLALGEVKLTGREWNTLFMGPMNGGAYAVAVRPEGHDRWTYAPGTEDRLRASPVGLEEGKTADIGVIDIDCGPTIAVRPRILSGDPVPDLREGKLEVVLEQQAAPLIKLPQPRQEVARRLIRLRGLPEGKFRVGVTLTHPYFIPTTIRLEPLPVTLERGGEAVVPVPVAAIGGAIVVSSDLGAAGAVLSPLRQAPSHATVPSSGGVDPGDARRAIAIDGMVRFEGVTAGAYRLEVFFDAECTRPIRSWDRLQVEPEKTVRLP